MYVIALDTKLFINQLKTLSHCIGDYTYVYLTKDKFLIGDLESLGYCYYQYDQASFTEQSAFKISSESLLKIKGTKSPKGQCFIFIDEASNLGGIYLEGNNLGFELQLEPVEYKEPPNNFTLVISSYDLAQISFLSKSYKEVYLTNNYLIGFEDTYCGFSQLTSPLATGNFSLTLAIKTTVINSLVKLTDLFFCSLTEKGLTLSDDFNSPSFIFQTGTLTSLTDFQELIIKYIGKDRGQEVSLGNGVDLCNLVGTVKSLANEKLISFGTKGEIDYLVDGTLVNLTTLDIELDYPLYLDVIVLDKVLSCFKKSTDIVFTYIDSYRPVFITDEKKLHYEVIIPYRVIESDNEDTGN